jgi:23S rRNA (cytosine1962-C5)-methyltransferase
LGWGLYSPESDIVVRLLTWGDAPPDEDWLAVRIAAAFEARARLGLDRDGTDAYRMINSEGDRLPGLTVDRYRDTRVVAITTAPMAARRDAIEAALRERGASKTIVLVPESAAAREGIEAGAWGDAPSELCFSEHGLTLACPAPPAQKTGAYLDQRDNRRIVAALAAGHGGPMLDLGCHVGGFSVHAARAGVSSVAVDQSKTALAYVRRNAEPFPDRVSTVRDDMFGPLDAPSLAGPFGTIVFDPPKVAANKRDRSRALSAVGQVVRRLLPRVDDAGFFVACSCSHHVGREDLDALVSQNARGSAWVRVLALGPGPDHPVLPGHAEGEYLRVNVYQRRA